MSMAAAMVLSQGAESRRRRDEQGRFAEGGQGNRNEMSMGYDEGGSSGEMRRGGRRNDMAYNEGGSGGEMRRGGRRNEMAYDEGGSGGEMRRGGRRNDMAYNERESGGEMRRGGRRRRSEMDDESPEMGGEGYFTWDGMHPPWHLPPERYGWPNGAQDGEDNVTDMAAYTRRRNAIETRSHMEENRERGGMSKQGRIGFGENGEHEENHMTRDKAEMWIRSMKTPEGKPLQSVPFSEIQRIAPNYGVEGERKMVEFWVVVNMVKSDYQDVGKKYASDAVDFYAALAKDWLSDNDAVEDKLMMYKKYIVDKVD